MIKVGFDISPLRSGDRVRGIGHYAQNLLNALNKIKDIKVNEIDINNIKSGDYDVIHYQRFNPYFLTLPLTNKAKSVLTIHDLIYLIYPKAYPSGIKGKIKFMIQKYLARKMDAIITVSETSKKDIVRLLGIPQDKIFVTHEAPQNIFKKINDKKILNDVIKRYSLPNKFILYLGDVNYNKNLITLCDAAKMINIPLVIIGKKAADNNFDRGHIENKPLVKLLNKYKDDPTIKRLGFISDDDLVAIFNIATVYCQPSIYEGFGLPPLQALACETPVVASKIQAHTEVLGDAVVYADPKSVEDFAAKIKEVINNTALRSELIRNGRIQAKKYSWEETASKTAEVYRKICA